MIFIIILVVIAAAAVFASPTQHKGRSFSILPTPAKFHKQNGTKWNIDYVGNIHFTGVLGDRGLGGDKCRSSFLGGQHIWNCGDMMCGSDVKTCGFSMGPAFYGTSDVTTINSSAYTNVGDYQFASAWTGDPKPISPQTAYGMDTSNVAPINDTTGVAYVWEVTRGAADLSYVAQGAGVVAVTLGTNKPVATRIGPLLTGSSSVDLGLFSVLRAGNYIYNYNQQGPTGNLIVGRVEASDAAFDASRYEYMLCPSDTSSTPQWTSGIPTAANAAKYGMRSSESSGRFSCDQYGDVFWNNYFSKYMLLCTLYMHWTFFYLGDNPWGPWSQGYKLLGDNGWHGYGASAHPSYSPHGSHDVLYFSQGPNGPFNMFKVSFKY